MRASAATVAFEAGGWDEAVFALVVTACCLLLAVRAVAGTGCFAAEPAFGAVMGAALAGGGAAEGRGLAAGADVPGAEGLFETVVVVAVALALPASFLGETDGVGALFPGAALPFLSYRDVKWRLGSTRGEPTIGNG